MDGIRDYILSPNDCITLDAFKLFGTFMSARAFEIIHEKSQLHFKDLYRYLGKNKIN